VDLRRHVILTSYDIVASGYFTPWPLCSPIGGWEAIEIVW